MEGMKYINLIQISKAVTEIQVVENGKLVVPVNNTLVCSTSFMTVDTQLCVLIWVGHFRVCSCFIRNF